jgi:poly(3-hydroxybutyrate) depolymerase
MKTNKLFISILSITILVLLIGCQKSKKVKNLPNQINTGSGKFTFTYDGLSQKPINIYYYVPPTGVKENMPILLVFHGDERNANDYINIWMNAANKYGFMVFAPEFTEAQFPGSSAYHIGNVYLDGNYPTAQTLNNENLWTFSMIEPLFDFIRDDTKSSKSSYFIFGHSAGGQFVHRFVMFKPSARINMAIAANSGWYTVADGIANYPYGIMASPLQAINPTTYFSKNLTISVGVLDNNAKDPSLRHNASADLQGLNRLQRADYFFSNSKTYANRLNAAFNWQLRMVNNSGHDANLMSLDAADLFFK